jgi:aminoglycoside phosphotransferase (APT) family kinase protein
VQMDEQEGDVGVGHRTSTVACGRVDAKLDHASAALDAARGAGLAVDRAEVVSVAANVLVRLDPGPIAARLTGATEGFRDSAANLGREARLAAALAAAGALPEVLPAIERGLATLGAAPPRIVHGDSHPGNVLWTVAGPLWSDWEDAHLGPLEWDLACLVASGRVRGEDFGWGEAALGAHGAPYDGALLDACVDARVAQGAAYLAATGRGEVGGHLAWLRGRAS